MEPAAIILLGSLIQPMLKSMDPVDDPNDGGIGEGNSFRTLHNRVSFT